MRGGTVCSGIGAPEMAAPWIDWRWCSEIEPFPSAVLAHQHPEVPNLGDMTNFKEWPDDPIDLLVGGTPCQSFSVAGLRKGLDDPRGNLALTYLAVAERYHPRWLLWENVPGVLSSNGGRDFGAFLGGLAELGYGFAYRVLDAEYIRTCGFPWAVPQRRRRVFVVGYLGDWRRAAAVLFDRESLLGNSPPRREAGQGAAPTLAARASGGGGLGTDFDLDGGLITSHDPAVTLTARDRKGPLPEADLSTVVAHTLRGEGFDASEDGTGRGTPLVPIAFDTRQITSPGNVSSPQPGDPCHPLAAGAHPPPIAFDCKGTQVQTEEGGATPTLRAMGHANSHQNAGGQLAVAIQERAVSENVDSGPDGAGFKDDGSAYTLEARQTPQMVATTWAVRRLTPRECERLQGFPDDFTAIPWRGKPASQCPDGHRYKALGNSMAVNCMEWIFDHIRLVDEMEAAT